MAPVVSVRGLMKRYGGVTALNGMNLDVTPGAIHAVVGENGAGKSTLMKVLAGVVQPDAGQILLEGQRSDDGFARRREAARHRHRLPGTLAVSAALGAGQPVRQSRAAAARAWCRLGAMGERSRDLLDRLGLRVDVDAPRRAG